MSVTWAAAGRQKVIAPDPIAFFAVELGGNQVIAKSYLVGGGIGADKKAPREYTIRLTLTLTDDAAPVQAFQNGQTFASLRITLFTAAAAEVARYTVTNATVVGYKQTGDGSSHTFDQDLVSKSSSLSVS